MKSIDFLFQELTKKEQQTISGGSSTEENFGREFNRRKRYLQMGIRKWETC